MPILHQIGVWIFAGLWLFWIISGMITSTNNKKTDESESKPFYKLHVVITAFAFTANTLQLPGFFGGDIILPRLFSINLIGFLLLVLGVGLALWSRIHLGRAWSSAIQSREQQHLIQSGPYRMIRHPIYTGILLSVFGLFLMNPQIGGLISFLLLSVSYLQKTALEERFLITHFGDEYRGYMRNTYRLLPLIF